MIINTPLCYSHLQGSGLSVIVETNFQVCAYVYSDLHLEMLKLFAEVLDLQSPLHTHLFYILLFLLGYDKDAKYGLRFHH